MSAVPRPPRAPSERGFTLLELVVSLALFFLFLAISYALYVQALHTFALSAKDLRQPEDQSVIRLFKADVARTWPPAALEELWSYDPLTLVAPDGEVVVYLRAGERWERHRVDPETGDGAGRLALPDVLSFRWKRVGERSVEIEIVRRIPEVGGSYRAATPLWNRDDSHLETLRWVCGSRLG